MFNLEQHFIQFLSSFVHINTAVRIEHTLIALVALVIGFIVGQLHMIKLIKPNYHYNDKLKNFVYQVNECDDIVDIEFKRPKTLRNRLELLIGFYFISYAKTPRLQQARATKILRWGIAITTVLTALFIICILFIMNVLEI